MRIGIIIPDRGDRPLMLKNCLRMIAGQTILPAIIEVVDDPPAGDACDITYRYRIGYERLRNKDLDVIAFMENDDWYDPEYLETMVKHWNDNGRPELLGLNHTIYYHVKRKAWFYMGHDSRSSAMNTLIKPDLYFDWCVDHYAYTDLHLWLVSGLKGVIVKPEREICLGIKHGVGMTGGKMHVNKLHRFINQDQDLAFLKQVTSKDPEGLKFLSMNFDL